MQKQAARLRGYLVNLINIRNVTDIVFSSCVTIFFCTLKIERYFSEYVFIVGEYKEITGEEMTSSRGESVRLLESMSEVRCENGMYYSASKKSGHIVKMVEEQNAKRPPPRQICNRAPYRPNNSSCSTANRSMVS